MADRIPKSMRAAVCKAPGVPLEIVRLPMPEPDSDQVLVKVHACGVCRTDLHVADGELPEAVYPIIPGHQVVGRAVTLGANVRRLTAGDRVGIPWIGGCCGRCPACLRGEENLCDTPQLTGCNRNGGFADYVVAGAQFCLRLPDGYSDTAIAPLLCGGAIGYRALRMAGDAAAIGIYGFGSAAHLITQVALHQGRQVFAFTRAGDFTAQDFARQLGAEWVGDASMPPPRPLDAAIIFAPAGELVPAALAAIRKGGVVVCAGIHMTDIPSFAYRLLWGERQLRSVANLTRRDGEEFLALAPQIPIAATVETHSLEEVATAIGRLRNGSLNGSAVIVIDPR